MIDLPDSARWQLWIAIFGFFMQLLDTTIVNTALSSMAQSLGESPLHMHMVVVSYVLTVVVTLPVSGWLVDKVGVRNIPFIAIVLSILGLLFCALSDTLNELLLARALQGAGGATMVPIGRLTVMKIAPRKQYMAAMTFITLPGWVDPLLDLALGGLLMEYASWHRIFLINIPVGIAGVIATSMLMPNYTMRTWRFDLSGLLLLVVGMAVLTLALDDSRGTGLSPLATTGLVAVSVVTLVLYPLHVRDSNHALSNLKLFRTRTFSPSLAGSFAGRTGSGMLPSMTPVFLQISLDFSPFHARLMMIPMVLGSMGTKRTVVQVVSHFGCRRVLMATTLGLSLVTLLSITTAPLGWYYVLSFIPFLQGMVNSTRSSFMNTLTLRGLPDNLASNGNSLLSMIMQLSMSTGVTIAGLLLGLFGSQHVSVDSGTTQTVSMYTRLSMALIIVLPVFIFVRVPSDTHQNVAISQRKRSAQ